MVAVGFGIESEMLIWDMKRVWAGILIGAGSGALA